MRGSFCHRRQDIDDDGTGSSGLFCTGLLTNMRNNRRRIRRRVTRPTLLIESVPRRGLSFG
jgi:hypothetical protein